MNLDYDDDVDEVVIRQNKVSITPIRYDLTDVQTLPMLKKWNIRL
jgi:broad specificity polyphosphatase/5'/3'-nucleotidase SurE